MTMLILVVPRRRCPTSCPSGVPASTLKRRPSSPPIARSAIHIAPHTYCWSMHFYDPLDVTVRTPRLTLIGASDQWLARLAPLVRAGKADAIPDPYDDPMSLYERDPIFA